MFKTVRILDRINSTNSYILDQIEKMNLPAIVFSRQQTAGRGRIGKEWLTSDKGLFSSIALNAQDFSFERFHYPYLISLIIRTILKEFQIHAKIKWPNDLLVEKKKISGILIEAKDNILIIGIGINVNETPEDFEQLNLKATSISILRNQLMVLDDLYPFFIDAFSKNFLAYQEKKENIFTEWKENSIHFDDLIRCNIGNKIVEGVFHDIGKEGELLLDQDGKMIRVWAGEIIET